MELTHLCVYEFALSTGYWLVVLGQRHEGFFQLVWLLSEAIFILTFNPQWNSDNSLQLLTSCDSDVLLQLRVPSFSLGVFNWHFYESYKCSEWSLQ